MPHPTNIAFIKKENCFENYNRMKYTKKMSLARHIQILTQYNHPPLTNVIYYDVGTQLSKYAQYYSKNINNKKHTGLRI